MKNILKENLINQKILSYAKRFFASRLEPKNYNLEAGFGILEAMISVFMIMVGVVGALSLTSVGINGMGASKSRLIAANLAQEGLEVVHNIRDSNWLESPTTPWNDWGGDGLMPDDCTTPCSGNVLWNSSVFPDFGIGSDIKWNDANYHYDNTGTIGESFSREIFITDLGDLSNPTDGTNDYSKVQVIVGWGPSGTCAKDGLSINRRFCLVLEERLYDWLE